MIRINALIIALVFLASCSTDKAQETSRESADTAAVKNETTNSETKDPVAKSGPLKETFTEAGDSIIIPGFEIALELSPNAEQKLKESKESVIVSADLSGQPTDTTTEDYLEMGEKYLINHRIELFTSRVARFDNVKISKADYESLKDKNFQVLINVFSGRRSSGNNLLDCDILQDGIETVKGKKHTLKGKLIGE